MQLYWWKIHFRVGEFFVRNVFRERQFFFFKTVSLSAVRNVFPRHVY